MNSMLVLLQYGFVFPNNELDFIQLTLEYPDVDEIMNRMNDSKEIDNEKEKEDNIKIAVN